MGFCPTDFYVPYTEYLETPEQEPDESIRIIGPNGQFGFVAGCVWGDDISWKIQFLDLSRIKEGVLTRDDRFGYIELPSNMELKDAIEVRDFSREDYELNDVIIEIKCCKWFNLKGQ